MAYKSNATVYSASREKVWQALEQTCGNLKWTPSLTKPEQGLMEVKSRASILCPMGILLSIRLTSLEACKTQIHIEAKSKGQLVDYGQTSREIKRFFEVFDKLVISVNGTATENADRILCSKCGCSLEPGVKFCRKCGEPVTVPDTTNKTKITPCQNSSCQCGKELDSSMKFCPQCGKATD